MIQFILYLKKHVIMKKSFKIHMFLLLQEQISYSPTAPFSFGIKQVIRYFFLYANMIDYI
jgi:hypothetical protein